MPQLEVQPATFQFWKLCTTEPSADFSTQPLPSAADSSVVSSADSADPGSHLRTDGGSSVQGEDVLPVEAEPGSGRFLDQKSLACANEDPPIGELELQDQVETFPRQNELFPIETLDSPDPAADTVPVIRRSNRHRLSPNRLQYATLGTLLISVIQTLFHGLVDAYSDMFTSSTANNPLHSHIYTV
ncbi:hypothetical protein ATANTOWER_024112 [Ataeniobius toweri]|uniref:Uncharacterized protein n=1 Tax=Ataeniobius toweri TaxID=208326 RepID=A0ABU7ASS7_9TELE|nr:hypothetical protein [Ataeniobius toweri]